MFVSWLKWLSDTEPGCKKDRGSKKKCLHGMEGKKSEGWTLASLKAIIPGAGVVRLVTRFAGPYQHISWDQICDLTMHFNFRPQ